ncbi:MAG: hypothetical protein DYG89_15355 [Caldilinea sp. CFX5]|nr:hypothetical protein [Caldilinea sp. CFX5]
MLDNPLVRILGQHAPAHAVLQQAAQSHAFPLSFRPATTAPATDYTLVDPALTVMPPLTGATAMDAMPPTNVGYAAFTPKQRAALLYWLNQPTEPAPSAFQQFYLAHLEVGLLEAKQLPRIIAEVQRLQGAVAWQQQMGLARLHLLTYWLTQDGVALSAWAGSEQSARATPGALAGVALGLQALLNQPLQPQQLPALLQQWSLAATLPSQALLTLRLSSLAATLGQEPLAYALAQLGEAARQPQPWRTQHRDLRFALPQPDVRPLLEPLLRDFTALSEEATTMSDDDSDDAEAVDIADPGWQLVLEFGESRSDFFTFALELAQRLPGYVALMDEDRHLIHRIHFRKGEVRHFWRLWEYVQSWSSVKVYLNGDEVNKFELYGRLWQVR